jgi:Holliday junction resolvase
MAMKEQALQTKIIKWLTKNGFYSIKVVVATKSGVTDIIACSPHGKFIAIEVKVGYNKPSKLQLYNIDQVNQREGIGFVTWDLQTVIDKLDHLAV